jgi:hypothetical protein
VNVLGRMSFRWFRVDQLWHGTINLGRAMTVRPMVAGRTVADGWSMAVMVVVERRYDLKGKQTLIIILLSVYAARSAFHAAYYFYILIKCIVPVIVYLHRYLPYANGLYGADGGGSWFCDSLSDSRSIA